ncbi:MAG: hypothetical protein JSR97_10320 [Verrucomicrobia bacterium]|nr:hypothetical protein [Verrucomicrobiota bacterium]
MDKTLTLNHHINITTNNLKHLTLKHHKNNHKNYLTSGVGSLTFNFTNLRADFAFYYFTNSTSKPILVAMSNDKVTFQSNNQPLKPRVVPTGDYDVFNLLWSSATSTKPTLFLRMWSSELRSSSSCDWFSCWFCSGEVLNSFLMLSLANKLNQGNSRLMRSKSHSILTRR